MSTLFLEAFGQLSGMATIDSQEEDLYSVFRERAELMRWGTTSDDSPLLWSMEEAEITADTDPYRIGFVQVGLNIGPFCGTQYTDEPGTRPELYSVADAPEKYQSAHGVAGIGSMFQ